MRTSQREKRTASLTLFDKISLSFFLLRVPFLAAWTALRHSTLGTRRKGDLKLVVIQSLVTSLTESLNVPKTRALLGIGSVARVLQKMPRPLNNYGKVWNHEHFKAVWIVEAENRTKDDPLILYFHGGAYVFQMAPEQAKFCVSLYKLLDNPRVSILALDYKLAPEAAYPSQLREAAFLYHQLVDIDGCRNISLIGDSCGAHLAISLCAHIKHGHPAAVTIESKAPPSCVVLSSPWVNLQPNIEGSYVENYEVDYLSPYSLDTWADNFCASKEQRSFDPWVSPIVAPPSFWEGVFPADTLVMWGADEIMLDDCVKFAKAANIAHTFEEKDGVHVRVILDRNKPGMTQVVNTLRSKL